MTRIIFVCHGNICRSPMAEFIFRQLVLEAGVADQYEISSAATSNEEIGSPVYPPAREELMRHGIDPAGKVARRFTRQEYDYFDYIIIMDNRNRKNLLRIIGEDTDGKVSMLGDWTKQPHEVPDPWYTGEFRECYADILAGCRALLARLNEI